MGFDRRQVGGIDEGNNSTGPSRLWKSHDSKLSDSNSTTSIENSQREPITIPNLLHRVKIDLFYFFFISLQIYPQWTFLTDLVGIHTISPHQKTSMSSSFVIPTTTISVLDSTLQKLRASESQNDQHSSQTVQLASTKICPNPVFDERTGWSAL